MASFGPSGFDANAPENNESNTIPKGEYQAVLVKSDLQETKDKSGKYLKLDFQICQPGEFMNKHVFTNMNLWLAETDEKKKTAVKIARAQMSELCKAVNVLNPRDSSELHNKPVTIKVVVQEANGEYGAQNRITGFKPRQSAVAPPPQAVSQPSQAASNQPSNASPWPGVQS